MVLDGECLILGMEYPTALSMEARLMRELHHHIAMEEYLQEPIRMPHQ